MIYPQNSTYKIKRITREEFYILSSSPVNRSMLGEIQRELVSDIDLDKFLQRYRTLLNTDHQSVKEDPHSNSRGTEIYRVIVDEKNIGFLFLNFYSWNILAPQLCIKVNNYHSQQFFSLKTFAELANLVHLPKLASELFIMWVKPSYRGTGLGRAMFSEALDVMNNFLSSGDIGFLTIRSGLSKRKSSTLFQYLLDREKKAHGENVEGKVITSGIEVSEENLRIYTGLNYKAIPVHPASVPMDVLSKQAGFRFMGYSSKSSTIYIKVW